MPKLQTMPLRRKSPESLHLDFLHPTCDSARGLRSACKQCLLRTRTEVNCFGCAQNHCCSPSMYTKVLDIEGTPRLVFFARFDLVPGQELTYDYRFKEEDGDNKLPCGCGAPNCRGTLN